MLFPLEENSQAELGALFKHLSVQIWLCFQNLTLVEASIINWQVLVTGVFILPHHLCKSVPHPKDSKQYLYLSG